MYGERLERNLPRVEERIERALARSGRTEGVDIVAVTKGHPVAAVEAAITAGLRRCGENRVPELEAKVAALGRERAEWHLVGHLQRNKVRRALPLFDRIHSIDSVRLARELSAEAERSDLEVIGMVQVNGSGEASKSGFAVDEAVERVGEIAELPRLRIQGLMTMAPLTEDEALLRRTFAETRAAFERCGRGVPGFEARHLSMGMSNDFEIAVEEGSTLVRLGTILFGERNT